MLVVDEYFQATGVPKRTDLDLHYALQWVLGRTGVPHGANGSETGSVLGTVNLSDASDGDVATKLQNMSLSDEAAAANPNTYDPHTLQVLYFVTLVINV